ncbi:peptide N-acetyl-beta-D-glucosaminyl asparaginase amidase A-domain-containing protein [Pseudomassariella vexata]|uniref:Peptide N-acetyl-beta-D-glucosaminyl asparaginase amidase A-domain-containing protein n=1 Tax=Pseudomassariella vexata TaxID=1141098 RepID=A0A1Y2DXC5_9PEZI|nr:peptide N-acetyl-beta-D-glucosaminyl asparaginase amidase A-domain-containing protein [Pseudomassariella vexata]ORY63859.1 peptide N-acetyl-beta-D-glucosaminyl asparaginase amidase A-domain-containing protein [Pseudomassariella vexata]
MYGQLVKNAQLAATVTTTTSVAPNSTPLECFQVAEPILTPSGASYQSTDNQGSSVLESIEGNAQDSCSVVLMEYHFASSYGAPFVGDYTPPDCDFNRVIMNFTVHVRGRQFDRLALMYLGDTEVWRTSTAEPTATGIRWEYHKDMTQYLALWKEPQTLIFDLGNIINDVYTGILNTTLTATFFKSPVETGDHPPADLIVPISKRQGSTGAVSQFTVPADNATNTVSFPRNVNRAVFSVSACGQSTEEFWWSNVPQNAIDSFDATIGQYYGYSPWREVQVFIDGKLAGVQWPFPVIFTGGVVPSFHRPIVGIDAFDLREHEIDITPWLPLICDGNEHTFTIQVAGLGEDNSVTSTVGSNWYVTGKIFVWLDDEDSVTVGNITSIYNSAPVVSLTQSITQNSTGANETLDFDLAVSRTYSVSSTVKSQKKTGKATWSQTLSYSNIGGLYAYGYDGINTFETTGLDIATSPGVSYSTNYNYPLYCNVTEDISPEGNLTLWAELYQGLNLEVEGNAVFPTGLEAFKAISETADDEFVGSVLNTHRNGTAYFYEYGNSTYSTGFGSTTQKFRFGGLSKGGNVTTPGEELYYRDVTASNNTVISNYEVVAGGEPSSWTLASAPDAGLDGLVSAFPPSPKIGHGIKAFMSSGDL